MRLPSGDGVVPRVVAARALHAPLVAVQVGVLLLQLGLHGSDGAAGRVAGTGPGPGAIAGGCAAAFMRPPSGDGVVPRVVAARALHAPLGRFRSVAAALSCSPHALLRRHHRRGRRRRRRAARHGPGAGRDLAGGCFSGAIIDEGGALRRRAAGTARGRARCRRPPPRRCAARRGRRRGALVRLDRAVAYTSFSHETVASVVCAASARSRAPRRSRPTPPPCGRTRGRARSCPRGEGEAGRLLDRGVVGDGRHLGLCRDKTVHPIWIGLLMVCPRFRPHPVSIRSRETHSLSRASRPAHDGRHQRARSARARALARSLSPVPRALVALVAAKYGQDDEFRTRRRARRRTTSSSRSSSA